MAKKAKARPQPNSKPPWLLAKRVLLWTSIFWGGVLAGMGAFLVVQIRLIHDIRAQVDEISGIKLWIGEMTFLYQGLNQKLGLTLRDIPPEYLEHSNTAGWTVFWIGMGGFGVLVPTVLLLNWKLRQ